MSRKRIATVKLNVTGGGGGTGPPPTVGVGPTYGPGGANNAGVSVIARSAVTMPALALAGTLLPRVAATMPSLAANYTGHVARSRMTATALGAPFWQSVTTAALTASAQSITVNKPNSVGVGDLLLAFVTTANLVAQGAGLVTTLSGWNVADSVVHLGTTAALAGKVMWRIADGTEGSTFTFAISPEVAQATAEVHRVIGTHATAPVDVTATATLAATALVTDPINPTVTTTVVNTMVFSFLGHYHAALSNTHLPPAASDERTDFQSTFLGVTHSANTNTAVFAATGATGTSVHDCSETVATDAVMIRVAIKPGVLVLL